ncbi:hypothetical protein P8452_52584 [Trifolium repens]|nr:hypothetical protein P8452_52584 [Trifolium repens]
MLADIWIEISVSQNVNYLTNNSGRSNVLYYCLEKINSTTLNEDTCQQSETRSQDPAPVPDFCCISITQYDQLYLS